MRTNAWEDERSRAITSTNPSTSPHARASDSISFVIANRSWSEAKKRRSESGARGSTRAHSSSASRR